MNDPGVITIELAGGPSDGQRLKVPAELDTYWIGPIQAAWVAEGDLAPENVVGRDLHCYRLDPDAVREDGTPVFRYVEPI